jgi:hypothetical protein
MNRLVIIIVIAIAATVIAAATTLAQPKATTTTQAQKYPDVVNVKVKAQGDRRFDFDVTISSPYETPQRYADAFRVMSAEGVVYGERKLLHDHVDEQPFTRDLYGVVIPAGVTSVIVQARDQKFGYGGKILQALLIEK